VLQWSLEPAIADLFRRFEKDLLNRPHDPVPPRRFELDDPAAFNEGKRSVGVRVGGTAASSTESQTALRSTALGGSRALAVGTILLGIGLGQIANERLTPPMWNWISFLGLTLTGMLVLVVGRGAVKAAIHEGNQPQGGTRRLLGLLATELLLVAGLAVMIYGALNNLVLGANGFRTGFKGNGEGLALWIAAALFLVLVRGGFKLALGNRGGAGAAALGELLYFAGVFAFIVGERSVISGQPPGVPIGGAAVGAALIMGGALFLLVPVRMVAKQARPRLAGAESLST
jgi:hypothetical protein